MKKAQASVEYLMTYGWAILVMLGIGIVIWQMGVLNIGEDTTPGNRGFSQIVPLDWRCQADGTLTLTVTNEAGLILNVSSANATMTSGGSGLCSGAVSGVPVSVFRPAQTLTITFDTCPLTTTESGDYYRAEVGIVYTNPQSGIEHLSYGKVWGPLE